MTLKELRERDAAFRKALEESRAEVVAIMAARAQRNAALRDRLQRLLYASFTTDELAYLRDYFEDQEDFSAFVEVARVRSAASDA